jgi:hypothetical protein
VSATEGEYDERLALAGDELARLVRRLRGLSPLAWTPRRAAVALALSRLATLTGLAEQRVVPELPSLANHALADAMAVIAGDAIVALSTRHDGDLLASVLAELRAALEATR